MSVCVRVSVDAEKNDIRSYREIIPYNLRKDVYTVIMIDKVFECMYMSRRAVYVVTGK